MPVNNLIITFTKNRLLNIFVVFFTIFLVIPVQAQDLELHPKLRNLSLSNLKGEVQVYYSDGYAERAAYFQSLVEPASHFFKKPDILGINVQLHLAVLGPEDWAKYTKLPYGIAHIKIDPPTAILAASADNVIAKGIIAEKDRTSKITLKLLDELDIPFDKAAATFTDLIGFHEMGHIYAHYYGCEVPWPEQKWLGEFVATYLAYSYMEENQPKLARLWNTMTDQFALSSEVKHTTLADFEKLYLGVGGNNYRWYQAIFHQKVAEIYAKSGISFVHALKKSLTENPKTSKDDPFRLKELDTISKGFATWAKGLDGDLK